MSCRHSLINASCALLRGGLLGVVLSLSFIVQASEITQEPIRISITPSNMEGRAPLLGLWARYLEKSLGRPVIFMQRNSAIASEMLLQDNVDFAWIASYHYVRFQHWMKLVAVPKVEREGAWHSYLIVSAGDDKARSLADLRGSVFAYPDAAGYFDTRLTLAQHNENSSLFFAKSFATRNPREVIEAVAVGLAKGGALDGDVWEAVSKSDPELAGRTRVVEKLPGIAPPPIVARTSIERAQFEAMQRALLQMSRDPEGVRLLETLSVDRFEVAPPHLFDHITRMVRMVDGP